MLVGERKHENMHSTVFRANQEGTRGNSNQKDAIIHGTRADSIQSAFAMQDTTTAYCRKRAGKDHGIFDRSRFRTEDSEFRIEFQEALFSATRKSGDF